MAIKKNDFSSVKKKFSTSAKYKPQRFFDLGSDFLDAVGLPGPAIGHLNMFLGHSDTGKTTALVKAAVDAQKKGILPVFIITEQKWSFEHAKIMGFECEEVVDEETGESDWDGFYIFNNDFILQNISCSKSLNGKTIYGLNLWMARTFSTMWILIF